MIQSSTLCVNGFREMHQYETAPLPPSLNVLEWLNGQTLLPKFYWKGQEGQERAGCGSVLVLNEVPHFDLGNDSPAKLWGGHAFDRVKHAQDSLWASFPYCRFFLPKFEVIKSHGGCFQIVNALNGPINKEGLQAPQSFLGSKRAEKKGLSTPTVEGWTGLIDNLLKEIDEGHFVKVVMARHSMRKTKHPLNPFEVLAQCDAPGATLFAFQFNDEAVFIGATPEHLYKRTRNTLWVDAVAGTRQRGKSAKEESLLEQELLKSPKEKREFDFVKLSIKEALGSICTSFSGQPDTAVLKTPYVQHLYNRFEGELKGGVGDDQILLALHPTAALGGYPRHEALTYLIKHEPFNRGWYASPVGFASQKTAEFVVAIRSALIQPSALHTFVGAGIVDGSTAQSEWKELEHKESLWTKI